MRRVTDPEAGAENDGIHFASHTTVVQDCVLGQLRDSIRDDIDIRRTHCVEKIIRHHYSLASELVGRRQRCAALDI